MVNGTLLNFGTKMTFKGHFRSVAKDALRFGCAKQSKNLETYLMCTFDLNFLNSKLISQDTSRRQN
jgi:hypothetical protein